MNPRVSCIVDPLKYIQSPQIFKGEKDVWTADAYFNLNERLCNDNQLKYEGQRLYETKAHRQIVTFLGIHVEALNKGKFSGQDGVQCRLLTGARGIGKSATLREFTRLCALIYPSIIPIYISFEYIRYSPKLQRTALDDLLIELLTEAGVAVF